jgi:hypothetical protein
MKKSTLKEVIKSEIKSLLSEGLMTTDEAFRILRDIQKFDVSSGNQELMGRAIDALQAAEVSRMMDRERGLNESLSLEANTADAFSTLRTILAFIKKYDAYPYPELMEKAIDVLQAAEVSRMMDRERGLNESLNPEVTTALNRFIKAMARKYGYEEQDAVYAIMAALEQRKSDTKYEMPGFKGTRDSLDTISIREEEEMDDAAMDRAAAKSAKKGDSITATSNKLQKLVKQMKSKAKEFKAAEGDAKDKIKDELKKMTKEKKQLEKAL